MSDTTPNSVILGEDDEPRDDSQVRMRNAEIFGDYELLGRIRLGGMAEVLKARRESHTDDFVAIKRILPSFTDEADYLGMFLDEVELAMRFDHKNIVRARENSRVDDTPFLVMDYVHGQDAGALIKLGQPVPVPIVCEIATALCAALDYAHDLTDDEDQPLNIVHRDVSPQNVLISYEGEIKLIDFGIAKSEAQAVRTQAGVFKAKYGYFSPEQASAKDVDRRSDVFSLGVTLFELLSGERLFKGSSDFSTLQRVRRAEIPDLSELSPEVPQALSELIARALATEPADRFQTAAEMGDAVQDFVNGAAMACDAAQIGEYMRGQFASVLEAEAAGQAIEQEELPDEGTGLSAFEDLEPVSTVSALAVLPDATSPGYNPIDGLDDAVSAPADDDSAATSGTDDDEADDDDDFKDAVAAPEGIVDEVTPPGGAIAAQAVAAELVRGDVPSEAAAAPLQMDWEEEDLSTQNYDLDEFEEGAPSPFPDEPQVARPVAAQPVMHSAYPTLADGTPVARDRSGLWVLAGVLSLALAGGAMYASRPAATGTIALTSTPLDAQVVLDGVQLGSGSPFVLTEVTAGESHELVVRREGYKSWSANLTLQAGQSLQLPPVALIAKDGTIVAAVMPAAVAALAPVAVAVPTPAAVVPAVVTAKTPQPAAPTATKVEATAVAPTKTASTTKSTKSTTKSTKSTKSTKTTRSDDRPRRPIPKVSGGKGMLRINSRPWSQVFVDGRLIGNTPQMSLLLPVGRHKVRLWNPQFKLEKRITVKIIRGGQVTRIVDLTK